MVLFTKCCFCVSLEPGCLMIAFMNIIGSIIGIIYSILLILAGTKYRDSPSLKEADRGFYLLCFGSVLIIFFVVSLSFAFVLWVGLNKKNPKYVKAYLIYCLVFLIIYAILIIVKLTGSNVGGSIEGAVNLVVNIYLLLVVKSYHQSMLEDKPVSIQNV